MGKINVLDKHTAELIAAGEVVERPSSVIKELCENSIDAGATKITVEIQNGGKTLIRVADNGSGIEEDDIKKAFIRNATSKIKINTDLDKISTLGFRGEALASISSVSKVELITKTPDAVAGINYKIYGGEEISKNFIGCPNGTTFIVRDLFYNVPARMKFLKKDVGEGNAAVAVVEKMALSHPEVAFTVIRDGKKVLSTSGDGKLYSAIYSVLGADFAKALMEIKYSMGNVKVEGYISKVDYPKATRGMQHFFINGRYVRTKTAAAALEEAYKGSIMVGKFPACVLYINVPFDSVDVNVHPAKIEVRFSDEKPVFDCVYHGVKTALFKNYENKEMLFKVPTTEKILPIINEKIINEPRKNNIVTKLEDDNEPEVFMPQRPITNKTPSFSHTNSILNSIIEKKEEIKVLDLRENVLKNKERVIEKEDSPIGISEKLEDLNLLEKTDELMMKDSFKGETLLKEKKNLNNDISAEESLDLIYEEDKDKSSNEEILPMLENEDNYNVIGEIFNTYIIVQKNNEEIIFIDKHAAHERMIYEKLKNEKADTFKQFLLSPIFINLPIDLYNSILENKELLNENGYDVDDFGRGTVILHSIPQFIEVYEAEQAVTEIAGHLAKSSSSIDNEKSDWIYHNTACRAAIKAGKQSHYSEILALVKDLEKNPSVTHCPHGRPVKVSMKKREFDKQFGRIV